jgi:hypothetical protein
MKAIRKEMRKIRQHLEDPTGEKQAARAKTNGFNKPLGVSEKLRAFLGLAADEKISRSAVAIRINAYVTEKGLKNGQHITLDATLKDLLQVPEGVQVTFLNIRSTSTRTTSRRRSPRVRRSPAPRRRRQRPGRPPRPSPKGEEAAPQGCQARRNCLDIQMRTSQTGDLKQNLVCNIT